MTRYSLFIALCFMQACGGNSFSVSKIIDGNSFQLSNGVTVKLANVAESESNVKILERYLIGEVLLYDDSHSLIEAFSSDDITAIVYNSDGDCINELLSALMEITDDEIPDIAEGVSASEKTRISFEHENGVLKIPVEINQVPMFFIFDTGASLITISSAQAEILFSSGKLTENDFVGKGQFSDANGDISEGLIINLSTVMIGNRVLTNVHACVLESQNAPLLFGQSALQKFGKVTVDYEANEIIFE
jgi:aspartyl protease family protein